MYAVLEIAGKQFKVKESQVVNVPKLKEEQEKNIFFDKVLLYDDENGNIEFGKPILDSVKVSGKIVDQARAKKILVFKKKRRKGYKVLKGHRQDYTRLQIDKIEKV